MTAATDGVRVVTVDDRELMYGPGQFAEVEVNGSVFTFSRYPDEADWLCDSHIGANGFPHFVHGDGSRCCMKSAANDELRRLIEEHDAAQFDYRMS
jgi:hypothetical protein